MSRSGDLCATSNDRTDHFTPCAYVWSKKREREREREREDIHFKKRSKCSGSTKVMEKKKKDSISWDSNSQSSACKAARALIHYTTVVNWIVLRLGHTMVHISKVKAKIK